MSIFGTQKGGMVQANPLAPLEAPEPPAATLPPPPPENLLTAARVGRCWPSNKDTVRWAEALEPAFQRFEITTALQMAAFMAVCAQESGDGRRLVENLDYTPAALLATFSAFSPQTAKLHGRTDAHPADPYWIAEIAYGGRGGNGPTGSGDGFANRGVSLIQQTGRDNLTKAAIFFGMKLPDYRDWQRTAAGAAMGSAFYWRDNRLNRFADMNSREGFKKLSAVVNRGSEFKEPKDWDKRLACYERCRLAFGLPLV